MKTVYNNIILPRHEASKTIRETGKLVYREVTETILYRGGFQMYQVENLIRISCK